MESVKEKSLIECLAYCDLRDLPKEWDGENVYLKAIALVAKSDGSKSYAYMQKYINGNDRIIKDFGHIASIKNIEKIYPFLYLDARFMPDFKTNAKSERIEWLEKMNCTDDLSECTLKELNKKVLNMAMQNALRALNNK